MSEPLLDVANLHVSLPHDAGTILHDVSFHLYEGEIVGLVGESGSGKSVTAAAIFGLLPPAMRVSGQALFQGKDLLHCKRDHPRGKALSLILQDPALALNPLLSIGRQLTEGLIAHTKISRQAAWEKGIEWLNRVGIGNAAERMGQYPHELSGGMKQRITIAMALICRPSLVIADEPTTALDVTVQAQILELLQALQKEEKLAMLLITHDLGVVAHSCTRVLVMYAGQIVESGTVEQIFARPKHPYTQALLQSRCSLARGDRQPLYSLAGHPPKLHKQPSGCSFSPRCPAAMDICQRERPPLYESSEGNVRCWLAKEHQSSNPGLKARDFEGTFGRGSDPCQILILKNPALKGRVSRREMKEPILSVSDLSKHFRLGKQILWAVNHISFSMYPGEIFGLGGESGCGKSTLGKLLMGLLQPTSGSILLEGHELAQVASQRAWRKNMQMIFQHPAASLDPRFTVEDTLSEPLDIHNLMKGAERIKYLSQLLQKVGLSDEMLFRLPHELSGGQKQRVAIARALALEPSILICDEPFSALDVSVQSQIINLLVDLHREKSLTYLVISHDLSVLRYLCQRLAIMYRGEFVEIGPSEEVCDAPLHPYTQALASAVLIPDPIKDRERKRLALVGEHQPADHAQIGCPFAARCPYAQPQCRMEKPPLREVKPGRFAACHLIGEENE